MLEFLKGPFLVIHFSYYTLMTFLMKLSVILLSMLMILLFTLNVIRHSICGNNYNCLLNLYITYETLDWGRKWLVNFNAGKTQLVLFGGSKNTGAIDVKMHGSLLEEKLSCKMLVLTFSSKLNWGSYIISIAKIAFKKIRALILCIKFLSPQVALYLYKYCCHIWTGAPSCYLELLGKLQKWICRTVGPSLAASFEPLAHRQNVASLSLFIDVTFVDVHLNRFNWFHFFSFVGGLLVLLFSLFCIIFLSLPLDVTRMSMSTVSFFTHLDSGILCV